MRSATSVGRWLRGLRFAALGLAVPALGLAVLPARADDDAAAIVKAMSDYVGSQKSISATFETSIEVVTAQMEKIQFNSTGSLDLSRPGLFRAHRVGGYADVEIVSDGKLVTIFGRNLGKYAQFPAPGATFDDIVAGMRNAGAELPAADLLSANAYDALMQGVIEGKHVGRGVVDGVECEHVAFRTIDTDWQLWVDVGDKPVPRKYVITSKAVGMAPQYTLEIRNWKTDATAADSFAFVPPAGATKVDFAALGDIDEVPPGATQGAK